MNNDLLNILSNSNKDIDNQRLMDYLAGKLSPSESQEVEQIMQGNDFMNDAMEGLSNVKEKKDLQSLVEQLNRDLHSRLDDKKQHKAKRRIREYPFVYLAVILVITLIIIAWFIIQRVQYHK